MRLRGNIPWSSGALYGVVPQWVRNSVPSQFFEIPKSVILTVIGEGDAMRIFCGAVSEERLNACLYPCGTSLWLQVTMAYLALVQDHQPFENLRRDVPRVFLRFFRVLGNIVG